MQMPPICYTTVHHVLSEHTIYRQIFALPKTCILSTSSFFHALLERMKLFSIEMLKKFASLVKQKRFL